MGTKGLLNKPERISPGVYRDASGIAAIATVAYGGWIGSQITSISRSLGNLEGRAQCGRS